jgi:hypothetical protein
VKSKRLTREEAYEKAMSSLDGIGERIAQKIEEEIEKLKKEDKRVQLELLFNDKGKSIPIDKFVDMYADSLKLYLQSSFKDKEAYIGDLSAMAGNFAEAFFATSLNFL